MVNLQLVDYIKSNISKGYSLKQIHDKLVQHGYKSNNVKEAINFVNQSQNLSPLANNAKQLKYSPRAIGSSNLLLYGLGYLFLHMYARFFIFFFILAVAGTIFGIIGTVLSYTIVIFDTHRLAKKIASGEKNLPKRNLSLTILIIIFILGLMAFSFLPKYYFAYSESSCDILYPKMFSFDKKSLQSLMVNYDCKNKVREHRTLFTFYKKPRIPELSDTICESEPSPLKTRCYFKKALDTKDYRYCYKLQPSADRCTKKLAILLNDKSICQYSSLNTLCVSEINECNEDKDNWKCKIDRDFSCDGLTSLRDEKYKDECMRKYGLTSE